MINQDSNTNPVLRQALEYREKLGWSIIPVGTNKKPLITREKYQFVKPTAEEIIHWFEQFPDANIAVITGEISGVIVADVDPRHGGTDKDFRELNTVKAKTGGGGWHFYFSHEKGFKNKAGIKPGLDIRADGGYVILPPSIHESGGKYEWIVDPFNGTQAALPDFVKKLANKIPQIVGDSPQEDTILNGVGEGQRNEAAAKATGMLLARLPQEKWENEAWPFLKAWNKTNRPPLPEEELRQVFDSIQERQSSKSEGDNDEEKNQPIALQLVEEIQKENIERCRRSL